MKKWLFAGIAAMAFVTSACTPLFMIGKGGERGAYLGTSSQAMYEMLCASGDLENILAATNFSKEMKDSFYRYNCSAERSSDNVKKLFASMTTQQRKDIRAAFKEKGYSVNGGSC